MVDRARVRYQKARQAVLAEWNCKCVRCGYDSDWRALELDHIHGDGYLGRGTGSYKHWERLLKTSDLKEVFQLLCANCHKIKTYDNAEHRPRAIPTIQA